MKNIFKVTLLLSVIYISCRKPPEPTPNPVTTKRVSLISASQAEYQAFVYSSHGLLTKYTAQWENGYKITNTLEYNGNKLSKSTNDVGYTLYTYQEYIRQKLKISLLMGKNYPHTCFILTSKINSNT